MTETQTTTRNSSSSQLKKIRASLYIPGQDLSRIYKNIQKFIDDAPERVPRLTVSEFAEQHRVLPRGTPYPGPWRNRRTPYLVDIMNDLSASSPVREVIFAKSAQVGATAAVENFIAYIIKCVPGPTMYCTANEKLLNKWVNKRLSPLLISCGLDEHIFAQYLMKGQRRTGNKMFSKEFPGGSLDMVTAGSAANLRMDTVRYLILDEIEAYSWNIDNEGDPKAIAEARTKAWKKRKKILYISTPGLEEKSHIWPLYEYGDQRRYFVPCLHCGELQLLDFGWGDDAAKLEWSTTAGHLDPKSIYYQCRKCNEPIFETEKFEMIQKGVWRPTARSSSKYRHSYHIGAIYSLMEDWESIVQRDIDSQNDPLRRRAFVNTDQGLPYKEPGQRPQIEKVEKLRGNYAEGVIQDGTLFLTMAVDVQLGSEKDKKNPARLELEVCGFGAGYRTWSVTYKVFVGDVMDPFAGAWEDLNKWAEDGGLQFFRSDGMEFTPVLIFVDSSEGKTENIVYQFCARWGNTFPIKSLKPLKKTRLTPDEKHDEERYSDHDRYRYKKKGDVSTYQISSNLYKKILYRNLNVERKQGAKQRPGFCDFPKTYKQRYFQMLTAEEERVDGSFYKPANRPNEALDIRVYNLCAGEVWLNAEVLKLQKAYIKEGASKEQAEKIIRTPTVLQALTRATERLEVVE